MTTEIWKAIAGFEGSYEVSNLGRVRSLTRLGRWVSKNGHVGYRTINGQLLRLGPHTGGYQSVHLYLDGDLARSTVVHILVAEAFIGPRPTPAHEVRHIDGVKAHSIASNLAWGTHVENEADKSTHGTRQFGETHPTHKLSEADVIDIRRRVGERQQDLADEFGCTYSNVSAIQRRKSWRHV